MEIRMQNLIPGTCKYALYILLAPAVFLSCKKSKKDEAAPAPARTVLQADTEVRSTIDVAYANSTVSDLAMMIGFMAETKTASCFYLAAPVANCGTVTTTRDTLARFVTMTFLDAKCMDGRSRKGSVTGDYSLDKTTFNTIYNYGDYFRNYNFGCKVTLSGYRIDEWKIESLDGSPLIIANTVKDPGFNPNEVKLTWSIKGKLKFTNTNDSTRNMTWEGDITKVLISTNKPYVYDPSGKKGINWEQAQVGYYGNVSGLVLGKHKYDFTSEIGTLMSRDFNCWLPIGFDIKIKNTGLRPFITGFAFLNVDFSGGKRLISFGTNPDCNNEGYISVYDVTTPVTFR